mgnify:CR=1 FL=1
MCDACIIIRTSEKCKYIGQGLGKRIRRFFSSPAESLGAIQPELPRMAVVPYSSDVLCTHKTRLQLLYTDVQQLKMVQMVSQSQFFRDLYLLYLMRLPICWKNVRNFKQNFAQKEGNRCKYFIMRLPCICICSFQKCWAGYGAVDVLHC